MLRTLVIDPARVDEHCTTSIHQIDDSPALWAVTCSYAGFEETVTTKGEPALARIEALTKLCVTMTGRLPLLALVAAYTYIP